MDTWSPTGWTAVYDTQVEGQQRRSFVPVQRWGRDGEPLVVEHTERHCLVDARTLEGFVGVDVCAQVSGMSPAAPGWSVSIKYPGGDTETRPVAAWVLESDGSALPMVPEHEHDGPVTGLIAAGEDIVDEYRVQCSINIVPPQN
ncbi:hypothetical protein [Actinopolyspora mortivallis]|uniref:Uncharacterized protein n=1 Tax=Actinopolyspora mortivallis TaxID=33906 RepID=A0A2T0GX05_ACTMO|nr:hypothetical protein [Actinopolyspora mortivallis]PRW63648.1 hypothetical protein CEP50_09290 [Actinopolyspora mortivallis]